MKKYPQKIDFYNDFASTNFIDEQIIRNDFFAKWTKYLPINEQRQMMKYDGLLSKIQSQSTNKDFINEISTTIQTFVHETNKEKLINSIKDLQQTISKNDNKIKAFSFEILSSLEDNLSILTDIISLRFTGDDLALYIKEAISILSVFKSKKLLFKLLSFLKTHRDIMIDDTSIIEYDIQYIAKAFNLQKDKSPPKTKKNSISALIDKYLVHPTIKKVNRINDLTFIVYHKTAFILFTIYDKTLYVKYDTKNYTVITMGFVPIKENNKYYLNVALKNDIIFRSWILSYAKRKY